MSVIEDDRLSLSVYETADEDSDAEPPGFHTPRQHRDSSPRATFLFTNRTAAQLEIETTVDIPCASSVEQLINEHSNPYSVSPLVRGSASVVSPSLRSVPQYRHGSSLRSSSLPSRRTTRRLSSPFTPRIQHSSKMGQVLGKQRDATLGGSSPTFRSTDMWVAEVEEETAQSQNEVHKRAKKLRRGQRGRGRRRMRKALETAIGQKLPSSAQELVERLPDDFNLDKFTYKPRRRGRQMRKKGKDGVSSPHLRTVYLGGLQAKLAEHRDNKSYQSQESQETLPFDTS